MKLAGLGGVGLVTVMVANEIFQEQSSTPISEAELESFKFETVTVNEKGEIIKRFDKQSKFFKEDLGNGVILEMVSIPGGKFMMGTEDEEIERLVKIDIDRHDRYRYRWEKPQHEVTVKPFYMGKYPITQAQWQAVMGNNPAKFNDSPQNPVERVSWNDSVKFYRRLSEKTGKEYRLPSEAEWEYACRGGTKTPFHFGETITTNLANYNGDYTYASEPKGKHRKETTPVGSFPPNAFGLYDMHGQVWEWCEDDFHNSYEGAPNDGSVWRSGTSTKKVLRGGSWNHPPILCRSASCGRCYHDDSFPDFGFRVVCVAPRTT